MQFICKVKKSESHWVVSNSLWSHGLYSPWDSPGQNTRVGSHSLLWGIFPSQRSNPGLPHCRQILYQLSHNGSPRILQWVAFRFSSRSSQPRNRTEVSCIAGRSFTMCNLYLNLKKFHWWAQWMTSLGFLSLLPPTTFFYLSSTQDHQARLHVSKIPSPISVLIIACRKSYLLRWHLESRGGSSFHVTIFPKI